MARQVYIFIVRRIFYKIQREYDLGDRYTQFLRDDGERNATAAHAARVSGRGIFFAK